MRFTFIHDLTFLCGPNYVGTTTRLVNSLLPAHNPKEGRLEVYYGGVWGTVCSSRAFTETNAKVACANLGFGYFRPIHVFLQ